MILSNLLGSRDGAQHQQIELRITYMVSFPRSGHHALIGFLQRYCDFSSQYCEFYNCARHNGEQIDCPSQGIKWEKKQFRCAAGNRLLKNHDFLLNLPYSEENRYVVQYRHPFHSIFSWYELEKKESSDVLSWSDFLDKHLRFWERWVNKWVVKHGGKDNVFLVPYESLGSPEVIARIAKFSGFTELNYHNLPDNYFKSNRAIAEDGGLLKAREQQLLDLIRRAGLKPLFH